MAENTKIQWADHTFNPWRGCTKVAPGCANCYADAQSKRNPETLGVWGPSGTRVRASESMWRQPVKWNAAADPLRGLQYGEAERPRVFCASLADVFEDWQQEIRSARGEVLHRCRAGHVLGLDAVYAYGSECVTGCNRAAHPVTLDDVRARLFALIDATPNLDWLLLTKRPENVRKMWPGVTEEVDSSFDPPKVRAWAKRRDNVWLGTSIATQEDAERNIPELLKCRDLSAKLFVSVEPLVGPVDLRGVWSRCPTHDFPGGMCVGPCSDKQRIDWVIVGGESGPHARPCNVDWVRSLMLQCQDARVPCFVKQLGAHVIGSENEVHELRNICIDKRPGTDAIVRWKIRDPKGGDMNEWPEDLRVREVPT